MYSDRFYFEHNNANITRAQSDRLQMYNDLQQLCSQDTSSNSSSEYLPAQNLRPSLDSNHMNDQDLTEFVNQQVKIQLSNEMNHIYENVKVGQIILFVSHFRCY